MINSINYQRMSLVERKLAFMRSLYTLPFFSKLLVQVATGTPPKTQFGAKLPVNRDFYLTEVQTNLGEVFDDTGSLFNLALWQGRYESLYRYDAGQKLPSAFLGYESRFNTTVQNEFFDDRQREEMPKLIKNGNDVFLSCENLNAKDSGSDVIVALKGFQANTDDNWLDDRTTRLVNESMTRPIKVEYFDFTVDTDGRQIKYLTNDNIPRLILGFAARNSSPEKSLVSESNITITDTTRRKVWNNDPLPLEFFAPRLTCLLDEHIFWLPTEYFFVPSGNLKFDLSNVSPDQEDKQGYQFTAITRNV